MADFGAWLLAMTSPNGFVCWFIRTAHMNDAAAIVNSFPFAVRYYWNYQYRLGREHIVPYLRKRGIDLRGMNVLEIGAGEGGVLAAFAEEAVARAIGFDIREVVVRNANEIATKIRNQAHFFQHNMYDDHIPQEWVHSFDLILMRDVIEHLDDTQRNIRRLLAFAHPGSRIFITFPPYYSAFGPHQHTLKNLSGKIPFLGLLPDSLFGRLISSGREADRVEVSRLRRIRLTIRRFKRAVRASGLDILDERLFVLRPVFKIKFGAPVIGSGPLKYVPVLREFLTTEASYLLGVK